jgi:hypothetical protein
MPARLRPTALAVLLGAALVVTSCGGSADGAASTATTAGASDPTTTTTPDSGAGIVNTWVGPPADLTRLPIGTGFVSTSGPAAGHLYVCDAGNPRGGGAQVAGPWIDTAAGTWDATRKVSVQGEVSWPMAKVAHTRDATTRTITSNGLPMGEVTGTFPIAADDPAYAYDRNPNRIAETELSLAVPVEPTAAASPGCLGKGVVGMLLNGVALFAPVDELNRDAVAYETQDQCDGHPQQSSLYHYHDIPSCIVAAATGPSTVVGFAADGHPIVVERDATGALPTDADLDECHGRTSPVVLDGEVVTTYHYSATSEFPYVIGCLTGVVP